MLISKREDWTIGGWQASGDSPCARLLAFEGRDQMNQSVGEKFPDLALKDHTGEVVSLSGVSEGRFPLIVVFYRGYW